VAGALMMFVVMYFIKRDGLQHQCLDCFRVEPSD
jgi:hypothetical protein